jgi:hypothetical protein
MVVACNSLNVDECMSILLVVDATVYHEEQYMFMINIQCHRLRHGLV